LAALWEKMAIDVWEVPCWSKPLYTIYCTPSLRKADHT